MGWRYGAASALGTSHETAGTECQDAHALRFIPDLGVFVGVVSDGAGSASHSKTGSRCACDIALAKVAEADSEFLFSNSLAADVLEEIRNDLHRRADEAGLPIREFACTLLVSIIGPDKAAFWQIGDGAICFRQRRAERFGFVFWPEKGDYANVTSFVTDKAAQRHLEFDVLSDEVVEVAMFTDGVERLALDFVSGEAHTAFFSGLFPAVRALPEDGYSEELSSGIQGFLSSVRVNERTDDDKTLLLASLAV